MNENLFKQRSNIAKVSLTIMISFCYAFLIALFIVTKNNYTFPDTWIYQFISILILSYSITLLLMLIQLNSIVTGICLSIHIICNYLATKPFSSYIWFEFFFIVIILLEGVLLLTIKQNCLLAIILLLSSILTKHNNIFWGVPIEARPWNLKLILGLSTILISGFCIIIKSGYYLLKEQRTIILDQNNIIKKLASANTGFQKYANLTEEKSITNERMRLTREIHDSVGYTMTNLLMMLEASTDLVPKKSEKLSKLLYTTLEIIKNGHSEMRQSLRVLRNTRIKKKNTIMIISDLADVFENSTGVNVRLELGNLPWNVNIDIENIIYRFLQEGMTNSLTHGEAKNINIHFRYDDNIIYINLFDDGNGCKDIKQGIGLNGMKERLLEVTGKMEYYNIYKGFCVKVEIPWNNHV